LQAAGAFDAGHARIFGFQHVQTELSDEVEGLQIVLSRFIVGTGSVVIAQFYAGGHWGWLAENGQITAVGRRWLLRFDVIAIVNVDLFLVFGFVWVNFTTVLSVRYGPQLQRQQ